MVTYLSISNTTPRIENRSQISPSDRDIIRTKEKSEGARLQVKFLPQSLGFRFIIPESPGCTRILFEASVQDVT